MIQNDDTISRQAAIDALHDEIVRRRVDEDTNDDGTLDEFDTEAILRRLPAQPERKTGKWTINDCHAAVYKYHCSACGANHRARYDFCPSCGADMREGQDGER